MAAQPFGRRDRDREREDAQRSAHPELRAQGRRRTPCRTRGTAGRPSTANGSSQREGLRIDQKRVADPVEAGGVIAEPEEPARDRGAPITPPSRPAEAPSISQTATGKVRNNTGQALTGASASTETRARDERDRGATPAPGEHHRMRRRARVMRGECRSRWAPCRAAAGGAAATSRHAAHQARRAPVRAAAIAARDAHAVSRRRGSASSTSISKSPGPGTTSPRVGSRPARVMR